MLYLYPVERRARICRCFVVLRQEGLKAELTSLALSGLLNFFFSAVRVVLQPKNKPVTIIIYCSPQQAFFLFGETRVI